MYDPWFAISPDGDVKVLERPPLFLYVVCRPAGPDRIEIAEHRDRNLKIFEQEADAELAAAHCPDSGWEVRAVILQPVGPGVPPARPA